MHRPTRIHSLDFARGVLLVAMLGVHLVSAHGAAGQVNALHGWVGVFLISSGFVALSGYMVGARTRAASRQAWGHASVSALQLVLVMVSYAVLFSLVRFGLEAVGGGPGACMARFGWTPPARFEDLGILLPIALVQVGAPLAAIRSPVVGVAIPVAIAFGALLFPSATAGVPHGGVFGALVDVLARRSLTPYYTVSTFVGLGLVGALAGRRGWGVPDGRPRRWPSALLFGGAALMASPPVSQGLLDPAYAALGAIGGSAATLVYWTVAILAFLRGCALYEGGPGVIGSGIALLGRHSLAVFVTHDLLLILDERARDLIGAPKGLGVVAVMFIVDAALLWLLCRALEHRVGARRLATALLLDRSHARELFGTRGFATYGLVAITGLAAVYTSASLTHPDAELVLDDFESRGDCPPWWTFGPVEYAKIPSEPGARGHGQQVLAVRGHDPDGAVSGRGIFCQQDIGSRRTLKLDVRGYGPSSGRVTIELYDDDNGNWEIEKDASFQPLYDDRFTYTFDVDWTGWRQLALPASLFRDANPGIGDDVFDPERDLTSGGLLQMQLLFAASPGGHGDVRLDLDNLRWAP